MSTDARTRQPSGTPAGGEFATGARRETDTALLAAPDPLVGDLGVAFGDSLYMSSFEAGTDLFGSVEIAHDEEGYRAQGAMDIDFIDGYHQMRGTEPGPDGYTDEQVAEAVAFLDDHQQLVETFFTGRYACELDGACDEWSFQRAQFAVDLDPAVHTRGSAVAELENQSKAVALYNETDAGTYGSPFVWRLLAERVTAWDAEVQDAQVAYLADVLQDSGVEYGVAFDQARAAGPDELAAAGASVRAFMAEHHDQIAQARAAFTVRHGGEYTTQMLGRDLSLAMHNPPGTPHGRMAFGALPTELGSRLAAAARTYA